MNLKLVLSIVIVSALLVLPLDVVQCTNSVDATPLFFHEIGAGIQILSPIGNTTYTESTILLNVTLYLTGTEYWVHESRVIPYQEISCVYNLDNGEWKNASFVSNTESLVWKSFVNELWYTQMECTYTAVLQDLPEGLHFIRVAVSAREYTIRSYNSHDVDEREASVNFTISTQTPSSTMSTQQPELKIAVGVGVATIVSIAIIAVVLKRKRQ
jgi:hypothetical protein